jgi:hypothetical protein
MSIVDRSHLRQETIESNCKNEPCWLDRAAASLVRIIVLLCVLSVSNCVAVLALEFDTPVIF